MEGIITKAGSAGYKHGVRGVLDFFAKRSLPSLRQFALTLDAIIFSTTISRTVWRGCYTALGHKLRFFQKVESAIC